MGFQLKRIETGEQFIVFGGGVAGLVSAYELLKRGCQVTVIERDAELGGLARTIEKDGFKFDIGGHRFHSNNPEVVRWLENLLGPDLLTVPRISHIFMNNRFTEYPIQFPGAFSIFSPLRAAQMFASYVVSRFTQRNRADISFEDWVVKRFGQALYEVFFEPYTEKVWGIPCNQLAASWASKRIGIPSMGRAIKRAIFKPKEDNLATAISQFYYPKDGFGMICQALEREIVKLGGTIYKGAKIVSTTPKGARKFSVTIDLADSSRKFLEASHVVSTIPLNALLGTIPQEYGSLEVLENFNLEYRDMICVFVALNKKQVSEDSWTYFPLKNLTFGRTHEPKNWSPNMVPSDNHTSLAVEIFSTRGEPIWQLSDDEIVSKITEELSDVGWINRQDLIKGWVLRVPYAYPVYRVGYETKLIAVKDYLSQWPNLHLVGRTGSFQYMNSDGVIEDVFGLLDRLYAEEQGSDVHALSESVGRWI